MPVTTAWPMSAFKIKLKFGGGSSSAAPAAASAQPTLIPPQATGMATAEEPAKKSKPMISFTNGASKGKAPEVVAPVPDSSIMEAGIGKASVGQSVEEIREVIIFFLSLHVLKSSRADITGGTIGT